MVWMTGVLRWRGATARIHAELALIGIDIPGPVLSEHDSSFRAAARLPPAEVAKRQAASCMQCATSPHPVGEKRRRKHKAHVSPPGNGRAPRSKEHSTPTESHTIGATPTERDIPLPVVRQTAFPNARRS